MAYAASRSHASMHSRTATAYAAEPATDATFASALSRRPSAETAADTRHQRSATCVGRELTALSDRATQTDLHARACRRLSSVQRRKSQRRRSRRRPWKAQAMTLFAPFCSPAHAATLTALGRGARGARSSRVRSLVVRPLNTRHLLLSACFLCPGARLRSALEVPLSSLFGLRMRPRS